ncbi:hypothetical protein VTJ83DRAFT_4286 [Remersonia thermophila]|uniref:Tyrosine specific protein phosphatases domain-containing protein n=1 Tax=Remersonia thermophila TaxID=72144 RepID=A0ABR4D9G9_9PEZI
MDPPHRPPDTHGLPGLLQPTVQPTAPYAPRPPSPPYIHVPPAGTSPPTTLTNPYHPPTSATSSARPSRAATPIPSPSPESPAYTALAHAHAHAHGQIYGHAPSAVAMTIHPSPYAVHTTGLPEHQLAVITRGAPQTARDASAGWRYESRRAAQQVTDFLWLGPASCVRDRAWVESAGVTLVVCARDARFAAANANANATSGSGGVVLAGGAGGGEGMLVAGVKRAVAGMGIAVEGLDVADGRELVGAFSVAAEVVNRHMLEVAAQSGGTRRGCVLLVCETGNDRSAAVAAAYLMTVYGLDMVAAVQFLQLCRFCVALGDDLKFRLRAYEDILRARGDVGASGVGQGQQEHQHSEQQQHQHRHQQQQQQQQVGGSIWPTAPPEMGRGSRTGKAKRGIDDVMEDVGAAGGGEDAMPVDRDEERYMGRSFAPFVEREG